VRARLHDLRSARARAFASAALAIGGYAFAVTLLVVGFANGQWPFPGGDVVDYYARSGDALRNGTAVYGGQPGFFYGPPWAVAFAALSWLGPAAIHAVVLALDVVALWVIGGADWRRVGWILWIPLIPFEIAAGQLNLPVAAAIVLAQRGTTWPLAAMSLAKVWPVLALPPRYWRRFLVAAAVFALVSLPWLSLWPGWIETLLSRLPHPLGPVVPVPFLVRAPMAVVLVVIQRSWSRALAAVIASPDLYWGQLVVLVAPLSLLLSAGFDRAHQATIGTASQGRLATE
jgi:hypothetical protein